MRKNKSFLWLLLGLLLLAVLVIYFITRSEKFKTYHEDIQRRRDDLRQQIMEKECLVSFLVAELDRLRNFNNQLLKRAERFLLWAKIVSMIIITGVGVIFYAVFNFGPFEASGAVLFVSSVLFNAVTILRKSKLGDLALTLEILKQYFIALQYKKEGFEPEMLVVIENRLKSEQEQLEILKKEYEQLNLN